MKYGIKRCRTFHRWILLVRNAPNYFSKYWEIL